MSVETSAITEDGVDTTASNDTLYRAQHAQIIDQCRAYIDETLNEKHVAGAAESRDLAQWLSTQQATQEGVQSLRDFYEGFLRAQLSSGRELFKQFHSGIDKAVTNKWISKASHEKWRQRFNDRSVSYKQREKWVREELEPNMARWAKVAEERAELAAHPAIHTLVAEHPEFAPLLNTDTFLSLHYNQRVNLTSAARAKILSVEKDRSDLYPIAQRRLQEAVNAGYLASGKVGVWLERIFKSNADPKKVAAFVEGNGSNSLTSLMRNWQQVKVRYDKLMQKASERGQDTAARGFKLVSEHQFLSMHYAQRLQYVEEAGHRLNDSVNIKEEQPVFVKIRHAMDVKDWVEASMLIAKAKTMHLKESDWPRLKSMERYVTQFSKKIEAKDATQLTEAKQKIDFIVQQVPSELQPMVVRLLRGPHGNRNIHQFRWIVYNNKWCRDHGYLNQQKARSGASQQNKELTKLRAKQGVDVGRNDVLDEDTSGQEFIRKKEYANHKATLMHVNMKGAAANTLAEWLEHEQDPKVLYWTTFCGHEDGDPKSDNWHNDLFANLTELRSLMRTVNNAGFMYDGPARKLLGRN